MVKLACVWVCRSPKGHHAPSWSPRSSSEQLKLLSSSIFFHLIFVSNSFVWLMQMSVNNVWLKVYSLVAKNALKCTFQEISQKHLPWGCPKIHPMKGGSSRQIPNHTQFCHVKDTFFNLISCRLFTNGCSLEGLHLEKRRKLSKLCSGIAAAYN